MWEGGAGHSEGGGAAGGKRETCPRRKTAQMGTRKHEIV
jgi:hypothetical protein